MPKQPHTLPCLALCLLAVVSAARGDGLKIGNQTYKNVKVVGMREGKLYYKTAGGVDQNVLLDEVRSIELDRYPGLAQANEAFAKEDFTHAAKLLGAVVDEAKEDYVKVLAGSQLVVALDRSGKFQDAAKRYAKLLAIDNGDLVKSARPEGLPADAAERAKIAQALAADAKAARDPVVKAFLNETIEQLKADATAAEPTADGPLTGKSGLLRSGAESDKDAIDQALDAGKAEQALKAADQALEGKGGSPTRLLYQRGRALAMLGRDEDALVSFMRIVVHFGDRSGEYYGRSLTEAGKLFAKQDQPGHARDVWAEAKAHYGDDSEDGKAVDQLIKSLPEP